MQIDELRRFFSKVDTKGKDDCHEWLAGGALGYGQIKFAGKVQYSHRVAYQIANNVDLYDPQYKEIVVRHKCFNRKCCNPNHLELGTHADNFQDTFKAGLIATTEMNSKNAKIRWEKCRHTN